MVFGAGYGFDALAHAGWLGVLAFKRSLFAGVLDGGAGEVFLQGTRLSSFMKSVEQVAGAMGEDEGADEASPAAAEPAGPEPVAATPLSDAAPTAAVVQSGAAGDAEVARWYRRRGGPGFRACVSRGAGSGECVSSRPRGPRHRCRCGSRSVGGGRLDRPAAGGRGDAAGPGSAAPAAGWGTPRLRLERDPETDEPSLRLPPPDAALLQQLAKALSPWLKG